MKVWGGGGQLHLDHPAQSLVRAELKQGGKPAEEKSKAGSVPSWFSRGLVLRNSGEQQKLTERCGGSSWPFSLLLYFHLI